MIEILVLAALVAFITFLLGVRYGMRSAYRDSARRIRAELDRSRAQRG